MSENEMFKKPPAKAHIVGHGYMYYVLLFVKFDSKKIK